MSNDPVAPSVSYKKERIALYSAILLAAALAFYSYGGDIFPPNEDSARTAMSIATQACGMNRFEFQRRYMDAKAEIAKLPPVKASELDAVLDSNLRSVGCKAP